MENIFGIVIVVAIAGFVIWKGFFSNSSSSSVSAPAPAPKPAPAPEPTPAPAPVAPF